MQEIMQKSCIFDVFSLFFNCNSKTVHLVIQATLLNHGSVAFLFCGHILEDIRKSLFIYLLEWVL